MKKSNKVSIFYIFSSVSLLLILIAGGIYGIYLSVGLNFARSTVSNITDGAVGGARNISYGGTVNFQSSMTGVIMLSIALIVLAIFDFVSLIRQITFFKQFKMVEQSGITKRIEKKVKSKGRVIFFAIIIDLLSITAGIAGIFININSFVNSNVSWVLYVMDALVAILAIISLVLLIIKLKSKKNMNNNSENNNYYSDNYFDKDEETERHYKFGKMNIDEIEYKLLKLKNLKNSKMITAEEYQKLHDHLLGKSESISNEEKFIKNN